MIKIEDLIKKGYREYEVVEALYPNASALYQKEIQMSEDEDDSLFIDAVFYDFRVLGLSDVKSWEFSTQLGDKKVFNINTVGWEETETILDEIEEFFKNLYYFSKHLEIKE